MFSACDFGSDFSAFMALLSVSSVLLLGAVPFIGCASIQPSLLHLKNSSGERDKILVSFRPTKAEYLTGWRFAKLLKASNGLPLNLA